MIDIDQAISELTAIDPELARVAELKLIGGLEIAEMAALLSRSHRTAERRWRVARMWLADRLEAEQRSNENGRTERDVPPAQ